MTAESIVTLHRPIQVLRTSETVVEQQRFGRTRLDRLGIRKLQGKEHVFCEGDDRSHVFQIEDGVVTIYRMLKDGRRQIIDFAFPGDFVGLGTTPEHLFSAEATAPTTVRCYSTVELEDAAKTDATLALQLYKAVSQELSAARALLVAIGQRSAIERVATFLLMLHRRTNSDMNRGAIINLPMRRADIGDFLGLTIETVSRTITKLRTMKIIDVSHGTAVRIVDLARLTEVAEGRASD